MSITPRQGGAHHPNVLPTRGISRETLKSYGATKQGRRWRFTGYPVDGRGRILLSSPFTQIRNAPGAKPKWFFAKKGTPGKLVFVPRPAFTTGDVFVAESAIDAMSVEEWIKSQGWNAIAVGVTGVAAMKDPDVAEAVVGLATEKGNGRVIVVADNDGPGLEAARVMIANAGEAGGGIITPASRVSGESFKDPNSVVAAIVSQRSGGGQIVNMAPRLRLVSEGPAGVPPRCYEGRMPSQPELEPVADTGTEVGAETEVEVGAETEVEVGAAKPLNHGAKPAQRNTPERSRSSRSRSSRSRSSRDRSSRSRSQKYVDIAKSLMTSVDVARELGLPITQNGNDSFVQCSDPQRHAHGDRTPSLCITAPNGRWYCHGPCKEGGDQIALIQRFTGAGFVEARTRFLAMKGLDKPFTAAKKTETPHPRKYTDTATGHDTPDTSAAPGAENLTPAQIRDQWIEKAVLILLDTDADKVSRYTQAGKVKFWHFNRQGWKAQKNTKLVKAEAKIALKLTQPPELPGGISSRVVEETIKRAENHERFLPPAKKINIDALNNASVDPIDLVTAKPVMSVPFKNRLISARKTTRSEKSAHQGNHPDTDPPGWVLVDTKPKRRYLLPKGKAAARYVPYAQVRKRKLQPLSFIYFVRHLAGYHKAGVLLREARQAHKDCPSPETKQVVKRAMTERNEAAELAKFIMAMIGRTLAGHRSFPGVVVLIGEGGNGKTQLISILKQILGGLSASLTVANMNRDFYYDTYVGGRNLIVFEEFPQRPKGGIQRSAFDQCMNEVKLLSGGAQEEVSVERKYGDDATTFRPRVTIWIATNFMPRWFKSMKDLKAWKRRIIPIPLNVTVNPDERIDDYADEIIANDGIDNIASLCLHTYIEWLNKGKKIPAIVERLRAQITETTLTHEDRFVVETIEKGHRKTDYIFNKDIYERYAEWRAEHGLEPLEGKAKSASHDRLREAVYVIAQKSGSKRKNLTREREDGTKYVVQGRAWYGARWINPPELAQPQPVAENHIPNL